MDEKPTIPLSGPEAQPDPRDAGATRQLTLIDGESDEVLLVPREAAVKRYTAAQVERIELKRNYILDLLGFEMSVEDVARRVGVSTRVVNLIGAKYAQVVAVRNMDFAKVLKAKAAKFLFYAEQKAEGAKFGELMVGVGIATQRATELEIAGAAAEMGAAGGVVDVGEESEGVRRAREFLARRQKAEGRRQNEEIERKEMKLYEK